MDLSDIRLFSNKRANAWHARVTLISFDGVTFTAGGEKREKKNIKFSARKVARPWTGEEGGIVGFESKGRRWSTRNFFFFFFFEMSPLQNVKYKRSSRAQSTQRPQFLRESLVRPFFSHIPVLHTRSFVILVIKRMGKFLETGLSNDP